MIKYSNVAEESSFSATFLVPVLGMRNAFGHSGHDDEAVQAMLERVQEVVEF